MENKITNTLATPAAATQNGVVRAPVPVTITNGAAVSIIPKPSYHNKDSIYKVGFLEVWLLGIVIVIGAQYFAWPMGLDVGFGSYLVIIVTVGLAYLCLCLCTSEICSALPFAGGSYGLARCTLGYYIGFVVGCCESIGYIMATAISVFLLGEAFVHVYAPFKDYQPAIWAVFFISANIIYTIRGRLFWYFIVFLGIVSLVPVLMVGFGAIRYSQEFKSSVVSDGEWFVGGIDNGFDRAIAQLPLSTGFFLGVEALGTAANDVRSPTTDIPLGQIMCIVTLISTTILIYFVLPTLPTPTTDEPFSGEFFAFNNAFSEIFKIEKELSTAISIPAIYATGFGMIYCFKKLLTGMADSGLFPSVFAYRFGPDNAPVFITLAGSIVAFGLCYWILEEDEILQWYPNISNQFSFLAYIAQCIGFIKLRLQFAHIQRRFVSPVGVYGAFFSLLVWLMGFVSIIQYQNDRRFAFYTFLGTVGTLSVYYFICARHWQTFSDEEKAIMFPVHVRLYTTARYKAAKPFRSLWPRYSRLFWAFSTDGISVQPAGPPSSKDKENVNNNSNS